LEEILELLRPHELDCLRKHALGKKRLVEIGVCYGGTSMVLRDAMNRFGILHLVDPFFADNQMNWNGTNISCNFDIAQRNVNKVSNGSVVWWRDTSKNVVESLPADAKFDFIFIDGDHSLSAVDLDWTKWSPFVSVGGVDFHRDVVTTYAKAKATPGWQEIDAVNTVRVLQRQL
jgi:hypothetical protein